MTLWNEAAKLVSEKCPLTMELVGKKWLFAQAHAANPNATAPSGCAPLAGMLLRLGDSKDVEALQHVEVVFQTAKLKRSDRVKELIGKAGLTDGTSWQGLAELSMLHQLHQQYGDLLGYDRTEAHKGTPDFKIDDLELAIEHVAPGEGAFNLENRREAKENLKDALDVSRILDKAKLTLETTQTLPSLTNEDRQLIAKAALARKAKPGFPPIIASDAEVIRAIHMHRIQEVHVFSTMYPLLPGATPVKTVRKLRQLKEGRQVQDHKWRILALSLPDYFFPSPDLVEVNRHQNQHDPSCVLLRSGLVWHAMYGTIGAPLYTGEDERLVKEGYLAKRIFKSEVEGYLIGEDSPYHAVIVSIFSSVIHDTPLPHWDDEPNWGDVSPLNLMPRRFLFERQAGEVLPNEIVKSLDQAFGFDRTLSVSKHL